MTRRFSAIVLDLDGTLIDSAPDLQAAACALLREEELPEPTLAAVTGMIGDGMGKLVERAFAGAGRPLAPGELPGRLRRFREFYEGPDSPHLTAVYPGVAETLARLRADGVKLGVCTNKAEAAAVAILDELGLAPLLDVVVGGDRVPAQKPDPAHIHATLDRLGVSPGEAAMVGDSPNDIAAGIAAGLPVVAVSWGYTSVAPADLGAGCVIDRFADLPAALDRLAALKPSG